MTMTLSSVSSFNLKNTTKVDSEIQPLWSENEVISKYIGGDIVSCDEHSISCGADNTVHAVYCEFPDIKYTKKDSLGKWSEPEVIPDLMEKSTSYCDGTSIDVDFQGTIHLIYSVYGEGIYYKNKAKNQPWTQKQILSEDERPGHYPKIAVSPDGSVYTTWVAVFNMTEWRLAYKEKLKGNEWSNLDIINDNVSLSGGPSIDVDLNKNVHISWCKDAKPRYMKKSSDGTWDEMEDILPSSFTFQKVVYEPCIKVDLENNVHIVFEIIEFNTIDPGDRDIGYVKKENSMWHAIEYVSNSEGVNARFPDMAVDRDSTAHFIWMDSFSNGAQALYRSRNSFGEWSNIEFISTYVDSLEDDQSRYEPRYPKIAIDPNDFLHATWEDATNYKEGTEPLGEFKETDIFYSSRDLNRNLGQYKAPTIPLIVGPSRGQALISYDYFFTSSDANGDELYYLIDWDDGITGYTDEDVSEKDWIGPFEEGEAIKVSHKWLIWGETYQLRCKTRDKLGFQSDWCDASLIYIKNTKTKTVEKIFTNIFSENGEILAFIQKILS